MNFYRIIGIVIAIVVAPGACIVGTMDESFLMGSVMSLVVLIVAGIVYGQANKKKSKS